MPLIIVIELALWITNQLLSSTLGTLFSRNICFSRGFPSCKRLEITPFNTVRTAIQMPLNHLKPPYRPPFSSLPKSPSLTLPTSAWPLEDAQYAGVKPLLSDLFKSARCSASNWEGGGGLEGGRALERGEGLAV